MKGMDGVNGVDKRGRGWEDVLGQARAALAAASGLPVSRAACIYDDYFRNLLS